MKKVKIIRDNNKEVNDSKKRQEIGKLQVKGFLSQWMQIARSK